MTKVQSEIVQVRVSSGLMFMLREKARERETTVSQIIRDYCRAGLVRDADAKLQRGVGK